MIWTFWGQRGFEPGALFASGAQGAWYDPSDLSTLFQDAAGSTAVTAVEQPVRLMRDKSGRGNDATAPNDASRPVLRAKYNRFERSEEFDNAYWKKDRTSISANAAVAPDGTTTADTVTVSQTNTFCIVRRQTAGLAINVTYTLSVYAKKDTSDWFYLKFWDAGANGVNAWFNLATGALGTVEAGCTASIVAAANGFYRCSITRTVGGSIAFNELDLALSNADNTFSATLGNSVFLWGAQLLTAADQASTGGAYQRVAAATSYDTSNPVFRPYLAFDGTDDSFGTSAIDFSGTDEMSVFAGLTKLSDASDGMFLELSADVSFNAGSFYITAPENSGGNSTNVRFKNRGSQDFGMPSAATFAAPGTRVLRAYGDISGDTASVFLNGASAATTTGDQGTGNYGNYPLFIGRRNNSILPFNGRLYSLLILGRTATAAEIASTEAWINGKTGAY